MALSHHLFRVLAGHFRDDFAYAIHHFIFDFGSPAHWTGILDLDDLGLVGIQPDDFPSGDVEVVLAGIRTDEERHLAAEGVFDPHSNRGADLSLHRDETHRPNGRHDHFFKLAGVLAVVVKFLHEELVVGADSVGRAFRKRDLLFVMMEQGPNPIRSSIGMRVGHQANIERHLLVSRQLLCRFV